MVVCVGESVIGVVVVLVDDIIEEVVSAVVWWIWVSDNKTSLSGFALFEQLHKNIVNAHKTKRLFFFTLNSPICIFKIIFFCNFFKISFARSAFNTASRFCIFQNFHKHFFQDHALIYREVHILLFMWQLLLIWCDKRTNKSSLIIISCRLINAILLNNLKFCEDILT